MTQRRLQVVLDLDTSRWTGRMTAAGGQLRTFGGQVNNSNRAVRDMSGSFDRMGRTMSTPLQKLRDYTLIMGNVRFAMINVRDIAVGWVASLVKQSAEVERLTILMKGMSSATTEIGRSKDAQNSLNEIMKLARSSGFAVQQLGDAFVKFKAGGLDPMDGSLKSLVNAVSAFGGTSESLHRASVAIQQMSGKGVISMEELRQQLGEAVPTAIKVMADAAGQGVAEFTKQVSLGKVKAGPALKGMFEEFNRLYAGSGANLAATLNGQLAQVRTNMLDISNEFTQLRTKTDKGGIKSDASGPGLYSTITASVKELNAALMSSEGKQAARELGEAINSIAKGLIWTVKTAIEWRSTIGAALAAAAAGFVFLKAVAIGSWMVEGLMAGRAALIGFNGALATGTGPLAQFVQKTDAARVAIGAKTAQLQRLQVATAAASATATRNVAAQTAEIARLTDLRYSYAQNITVLARHRAASLAALEAGRQSGRYRDFETGAFITQSRAIQINTQLHRANALNRVNSSRVSRQLAAAELGLAAATNTQSVATARSAAVQKAAAIASGFMARAANVAATAARGMGVAMSFALGPIGMIVSALAMAAYQAGMFTNKANTAAAAANRLAGAIGNLADVQEVENRLKENRKASEKVGGLEYYTQAYTVGGTAGVAIAARDEKAAKARLAKERGELTSKLNKGRPYAEFQAGQEATAGVQARLESKKYDISSQYKSGKITKGQADAKLAAVDSGAIAGLEKYRASLVAAGKSTGIADGMLKSLKDSAAAATPAVEGLGEALGGGKGDGAKGGADKAKTAAEKAVTAFENAREKFSNMIGSQKGDLAGLKAELAGGETALAKFQAQVGAGMFDDATADELVKLAEGFRLIDEAQAEIDFNSGLRGLRKEIAQTTAQADQMWASLRKGGTAFESESRSAQVQGQFSDKLKLAGDDQTKIAQINREIEIAIDGLNRIDAAGASRDWELMAEEIKIGLMGENEAREANYNLEIARQRSLIDWERLKGQEKIDAERRFEAYRAGASARLKRESESSTVKMARDWAKLGTNIDGALSGALSSFVDGMFEADFNFGKFAIGLVKNLIKIIIQAAIAYAILSAIGMANNSAGAPVSFGSFLKGSVSAGFSGQGNAPNTTTNIGNAAAVPVGTNHTGGFIGSSKNIAMVAGSLFNNAKTYHNGGVIGGRQLLPGEVPIIGMEGEQVLTKEQQRGFGTQGAAPSVQVNIINNSGTELNAEEGEPQFNAREMILNVVVEAAGRRGPFRDAMKGMANG